MGTGDVWGELGVKPLRETGSCVRKKLLLSVDG